MSMLKAVEAKQIKASSTPRQERVARAVLLVVLYTVPALICLHGAMISDGDIWWHLRAGEWMLTHRAFPHTDPFSRTVGGERWAAYSWIFELVLLKLYQRWALVGVVAYSTGMVLAITVAVHRLLARLERDVTKAVLLTMAVMLCMMPLYTPRPWLATVLFFVLEMDLLMTARRSGRWQGLLWLPVIFALWANIHIQFVNGLLVLGLAAIEPVAQRWLPHPATRLRPVHLGAVLAGSVLATLVNPYGWRIYQVAYALASQGGAMHWVTELQAIPFRAFEDFLLLGMALGATGTLAWGRRLPVFEAGMLALAAAMSFRSQRDLWLMAVVAGVILAQGVHAHSEAEELPQAPWPVLAGVACLAAMVGLRVMKVDDARLRTNLATQMPVKAVEAMKSGAYRGALYNTYDWGGYLMWTLREPVSLDGRAALYGDARLERSMKTWLGEPGWDTDPAFVSAGVVVAPIKLPLTQLLRLDRRFALVYEDAVAAVFVRK